MLSGIAAVNPKPYPEPPSVAAAAATVTAIGYPRHHERGFIMALTRRESVKLLGASLLAPGVTAATPASPYPHPVRRSDDRRTTPRPAAPRHEVSMKRLRALPVLLDY